MKILRWFLFPVSLLFGFITYLRNKLFDWNLTESYPIPGKSVLVGNLSTGGTGKTPLVHYIVEHFLRQEVRLTTLSRGYGRKTKGVVHADKNSTSSAIGDEPLQYFSNYGEKINVVVAEKRREGVKFIEQYLPDNELIILDDAFQHRHVSAGLNILVTPYNDLYTSDFHLPTGNLREWKRGAKRAETVVAEKCPPAIASKEMKRIRETLNFREEDTFFAFTAYEDLRPFGKAKTRSPENVLIVTGIGNPVPLVNFWSEKANVVHLNFPDHHNFTIADIRKIHKKFDTFGAVESIIVTTEKDYMRLRVISEVREHDDRWFYQPITTKMINQKLFNERLNEYYRKI